jgi:uncharacterized membrane protein YfcA
MTLLMLAALLALGTMTGFLAGLFGIGGGMLMVPFLTLLMTAAGFPLEHVVHMAIATSLATIMFTSVSSVRAHHARGSVMWPAVKTLAPGILVGAVIGAQIAAALPTRLLALFFAAFVGFSATQMLLNRKPKPSRELPGPGGMLATGSVIGLLSSLVGAGGGFVSVPFMVWCNVTMHRAVGTSAALGFPIAAAGTVGYVVAGWREMGPPTLEYAGFIYLPALVAISATSVMTAPLGARVAHALDVASLKRYFAVLLYLLAGYMAWKGFVAG